FRLHFYVDFAASDFDLVHINLFFRRTSHYPPSADIKLRPMPWTLHGAFHQSPIRKRSAAMCTVIAESEQALLTAPHYHALFSHLGQQHLAVAEFTLVAHRTVPAGKGPLLQLAGAGITMINSNLVTVDQRAAQPS